VLALARVPVSRANSAAVIACDAVSDVILSAAVWRISCGSPPVTGLHRGEPAVRLHDRVVALLCAYGPIAPKPLIDT
jgi:hypothetical protein